MSRQVSPATGRAYGLQRVTRIWGVSRATVYRHRRPAAAARKKPGPLGAMADEGLVEAIQQLLRDSPFHGEGYRKLWARLRFSGLRTSRRRVLRLMREHGLLAHQRAGRPRGSRAHDGTITTERVDVMWGADLTSVMTGDGQAAVFITVDHCSAECVGIHRAQRARSAPEGTARGSGQRASRSADRFEALEPVRQAVREHFGGFAKGAAAGLQLRHDHGSQYVSHDFQAEIRFLGIQSSPAFVRDPEGNGCAERFIRTLKENLLWVRRFDTVEELRLALLAFQRRYNQSWIIERHGYRTPAQVRADQIGPALMAA
jgi:putative transposase